MNIKDKIITILNSISDLKTIIYDSGYSSNVRLDRGSVPACIFYLIKDYELDLSKGIQREIANIQLFFCDRVNLDAKGEEKDVIVENMSIIAKEFLYKLIAEGNLNIENDSVKLRTTWGEFDCFVAGMNIELKISEKQGSCLNIESIDSEDESEN